MEILCPCGVVKRADELKPGDKVLYVRKSGENPVETTVLRVEKCGKRRMREYLVVREGSDLMHWITCTQDALVWKKQKGFVRAVTLHIGDEVSVYEYGRRCFGKVVKKSKTLHEGVVRKVITESGQFIAELVEMGEAW